MILPGVPRETRVRFAAKMVKLILNLSFQQEFQKEAETITTLIDEMALKAQEQEEPDEADTPAGSC